MAGKGRLDLRRKTQDLRYHVIQSQNNMVFAGVLFHVTCALNDYE